MVWQATPYAVPSLVAAIVSGLLVGYVWRYREDDLARAFLVLTAAIAAWSLVYTIQLVHSAVAEQLFWQRLGLSIGATIPTIWLVFTTVYAGYQHRLTRPMTGLLLIDPIAFALLAWTNGAHGLLWSSAELAPGPGLDLSFTPIYLVHITYAYLLVLVGLGLLIGVYRRSRGIYRRQSALLVAGAIAPLGANLAFTLGVGPVPGLDLTTPTFTLTGVVFALGLFRFDLLNLTPVARQRVLDVFGGGVIVVDEAGRVVDANSTARQVLPELTIGEPVAQVLPVPSIGAIDGHVTQADADGRRRYFEFTVSRLRDFRGEAVGHVIALQDVTTSVEYEQRLEVANRLLRHNLRNDMTKVLGWARSGRADAGPEARAAFERIETVARDVADLSRKSTRIETTLAATEGDLVTEDAMATAESVVEDLRTQWPKAEIRVEGPHAAPVLAPGHGLLRTAVRNLVENGIEHNDRDRPTVTVEVSRAPRSDGDWVRLTVGDDGPGIPAIERDAVAADRETDLEHGSGLGLWLVRWIAETAGGELTFEPNDPRGSRVTVRLRRSSDRSPAGDGSAQAV